MAGNQSSATTPCGKALAELGSSIAGAAAGIEQQRPTGAGRQLLSQPTDAALNVGRAVVGRAARSKTAGCAPCSVYSCRKLRARVTKSSAQDRKGRGALRRRPAVRTGDQRGQCLSGAKRHQRIGGAVDEQGRAGDLGSGGRRMTSRSQRRPVARTSRPGAGRPVQQFSRDRFGAASPRLKPPTKRGSMASTSAAMPAANSTSMAGGMACGQPSRCTKRRCRRPAAARRPCPDGGRRRQRHLGAERPTAERGAGLQAAGDGVDRGIEIGDQRFRCRSPGGR